MLNQLLFLKLTNYIIKIQDKIPGIVTFDIYAANIMIHPARQRRRLGSQPGRLPGPA